MAGASVQSVRFRNAVTRNAFVLFALLLLSGCFSFTQYKSPTAGPQATIEFPYAGNDPFGGGIRRVSISDAKGCMKRQWHPWRDQAIIPAGRPLFIVQEYYYGAYGGGCSIVYSFTPQEGHHYISEFVYGSPKCGLNLLRLMPDGTRVPEPNVEPVSMFCSGT